jgi:pimeloyl-ACP methyl ester carboxylesterase
MSTIRPFRFDVPQSDLDDLTRRLAATRWPDRETPEDWSQGIPLAYTRELCEYLRKDYDWRRLESELNALPQFITEIDGLDIQFIHLRSRHADALPMIMTHGWPGSVVEFLKVLGPLTDPEAHGGRREDAFHVVCPTLPGFGWSGKPSRPGWNVSRIGRAWGQLMARLGYTRWVAQGGDWGSLVTDCIAQSEPPACIAIHTNMPMLSPSKAARAEPTEFEQAALKRMQQYWDWESGYSKEQSTRPQTLGYGLVDSPVAQVAWIGEKYWCWTDCGGHPENIFTRDEMLDNIMMYWLPAAGASSARLYWESFAQLTRPQPAIGIPVGVSVFPQEIFRASRRWCEERFTQLVHYNVLPRGGHFAAFEQPALFVDEVRTCFRYVRG